MTKRSTLNLTGPVALLINECQRGLLDPAHALWPGMAEQAQARGIVARLAALAEAFRVHGQPVVFTNVVQRPDFAGVAINNPSVAYVRKVGGLVEGSIQVEPMTGLVPQQADHVVPRHSGMTVFYGTHLDSLLRNLQVRTLVAAGVSTNVAIPGMVLGGLDRGFQIVVAEDCIAGTTQEAHDALMTHLVRPLARVTDSVTLIAALAEASRPVG